MPGTLILDALAGAWLVAVNSCNDGVSTTVHPLNVALLTRRGYCNVGLSVNLSLVCLQIVNNLD